MIVVLGHADGNLGHSTDNGGSNKDHNTDNNYTVASTVFSATAATGAMMVMVDDDRYFDQRCRTSTQIDMMTALVTLSIAMAVPRDLWRNCRVACGCHGMRLFYMKEI